MRLPYHNNGVIFFLTLIIINSMLLLLSWVVANIILHKEMVALLKSNLVAQNPSAQLERAEGQPPKSTYSSM